MQAKDMMTPVVTCLAPEARIQDVAQTMKAMDIGFVPICENDRLVGTVTDRDIVLRAVAEGKDPQRCTARELMTSKVFWCFDSQTAEEVAQYMANQEVRRVVVLDRNKRLVGVISIGDLAKRGDQSKAGQTIRNIAEAPPANAAA